MRNSKRLLATLLTLCVMASFVCTGTAFAADEAEVTLTFPAEIVNVNGTAKLVLEGATADSWESSDNAIATVENGVVTGKAIGRVTITAKSGEEAIASIEIPVVGENLFNSRGVNHGSFDGGNDSLFKDGYKTFNYNRKSCTKTVFWIPFIASSSYAEAAEVVTMASAINSNANVLKYSRTTEAANTQIAIRISEFMNKEGYQYGAFPVDNGKLYEFTGWVNFDDVTNAPTVTARVNHGTTADDLTLITKYGTMGSGYGGENKSSDTAGWQYFNTSAYDMHLIPKTTELYAVPQLSSGKAAWIGDFYLADVSFHEVVYDPVFKSNRTLSNVKVGFSASTTFTHVTNTGKEFISFNENGARVAVDIPVEYKSLTPEVATITYREDDGTDKWMIDAVGAGEAIIQATATFNNVEYVREITFEVLPDEDQALVDAFDATIEKGVSYDAPTVTGVTVDGGVIKANATGGTFTLTADAEKNGNKFLYWAKGKSLGKKIISFSNELTNYMPEANDKNHILIAVYEGDVPAQEEWYNANGQRIATGAQPALPSMAGYGEAEGWNDYTDKIHVARYARQTPTAGINVTVEGENTSGGGTNLTYGDTVTCTATGENFKCWTKTGINGNTEIVSMDKEYKFQAWETCTVTALYDEDYTYNGNRMKIILDAFTAGSEKAVMAEFIGFGNSAVEKGIIWTDGETTKKIAMTKPGTQFTLTGNVGDVFTGYAIVDNDNGTYNEVTDGSVTISE